MSPESIKFVEKLRGLGDLPLIPKEQELYVSNLYNIDLEKVMKAKIPDFVRKVASELNSKKYFTCGYYLSVLSDSEILEIYNIIEKVETKDDSTVIFSKVEHQQLYRDLVLMAMLLVLATGKGTISADEISEMRQSFTNFIAMEYQHRFRKTVNLLRYNYDFFEHDRVIAIPAKKNQNKD